MRKKRTSIWTHYHIKQYSQAEEGESLKENSLLQNKLTQWLYVMTSKIFGTFYEFNLLFNLKAKKIDSSSYKLLLIMLQLQSVAATGSLEAIRRTF